MSSQPRILYGRGNPDVRTNLFGTRVMLSSGKADRVR